MTRLENDLRETLAERAGLAPPPRATRHLVRRARLRRARTGLLAGIATATIVVAGLWAARALEPDPVRPVHQPRPVSVARVPSDLAYVDRSSGVRLLRADGSRTPWLSVATVAAKGCREGCGAFRTLARSPDGRRLALIHTRVDAHGRSTVSSTWRARATPARCGSRPARMSTAPATGSMVRR